MNMVLSDSVIRGGVLHRFWSDDAIEKYCEDNYLQEPRITAQGQVTAWSEYLVDRIIIGWIS
jgi:hypothetical protein